MKRSCCSSSSNEKHDYQKVYCGTCKSIGQQYGQKARMLLNYDAVFLGEILGAVRHHKNDNNNISTFRCFDIPDYEEIPPNLEYSANVNLLFASLKSIDSLQDEGGFLARFFHRIMKKESHKAFSYFDKLGLSKSYFIEMLEEQNQREKLTKDLMFYAEPTIKMTASIFSLGAKQVDREDLRNSFYNLGASFGELIYFFDAYEDFDKDAKNQQFNAFGIVSGNRKDQLAMEKIIQNALKSVETAIRQIPMTAKMTDLFISRLHINVNGVLYNITCKTPKTAEKLAEAKTIRLGIQWNAVASVAAIIIFSTQGLWGRSIYVIANTSKIESFHLAQWLVSILGLSWLGLMVYVFRKKNIYQKIKNYRLKEDIDPETGEKKEKKPWSVWQILGVICGSCCTLCGISCAVAIAQASCCDGDNCGDTLGGSCGDSCSDSCDCNCDCNC